MKIATWNVNSVRARISNLLKFIEKYSPDILLLQEIKCVNEQFPYMEFETIGYNVEVFGEKSKNGVAILSKFRLEEVNKEYFMSNENESRYIDAYFTYNKQYIKIASIYVPNGSPNVLDIRNADSAEIDITETKTFHKKMDFLTLLKNKMQKDIKDNELSFYCGDYNICPNLYKDVYTPKLDGTITNTEQERQKFKDLLDIGMSDIWRDFNTDLQDYSWWGYRPYTMFQKNQGYRLDAILTTPDSKKIVRKCYTCRDIREQEKPSDHIPLIVEI
ncbi:MAG: exodeoxyribonuclease III [Rickettsiales bacterium]|jgi:exodeoxyribonuclease-3|nr:exodeoxyribonuclease III [Rickettsiales bacterium]